MITKRSIELIDGGVALFVLDETHTAIVDIEDYDRLSGYKWELKITKSGAYAFRRKYHKRKYFKVWMHRQIMHTPNGLVVHHITRNGLDNRKDFLLNCTPEQHKNIHKYGLTG